MNQRWTRVLWTAAGLAALQHCAPTPSSDAAADSSAADRASVPDVRTQTDSSTPDGSEPDAVEQDAIEPIDASDDVAEPMDVAAPMDARVADSGVAMDVRSPTDTGVDARTDSGVDVGRDVANDTGSDAPNPTDAGPSSSRHVARALGTTPAANGYWEYLPPNYSASGARSPLLVFWHGVGENGGGSLSELQRVLNNGPPRLIGQNRWPNDRPFVVLSPQHAGGGCPSSSEVRNFFTFAQSRYNVDPNRIYLTALSCGAIGSWDYLGASATTTPVAAAALICGNGNGAWASQMCNLGRVAIWGFHGDADGTVAPSGTINPMNNLIRCPAPPRRDARLTVYPGVGHDSWTRTYDLSAGHDIYSWMLANARP